MQRIVFSSQGILAISQRVNFCPLGPPPLPWIHQVQKTPSYPSPWAWFICLRGRLTLLLSPLLTILNHTAFLTCGIGNFKGPGQSPT